MKSISHIVTALLLLIMLIPARPVSAGSLRDDLLRIHANLLPKTLLMDYNFEQKLIEQRIIIDLACNETDRYSANKLKQYIHEKYPAGIKNLPITVRVITYSDCLELQKPASLYYLFPADSRQIQEAMENIPITRLVFTYDPAFLQYGAHIGLHIGRQIKPILNVDALKADEITLRHALVRISELYYQNGSAANLTN